MANVVQVVTAYVDLGLTKRPSEDFHVQGSRLREACAPRVYTPQFSDCWAFHEFGGDYPPANPRAEDRFVHESEHLCSNLIQHSPLQWVMKAAAEDPVPDVFVWMGYSIMKQGDFTGRRIQPDHIRQFLDKVAAYDFKDIPFPGITPKAPVNPHGDNWRFCGSTLILPRKFLSQIERAYKFELIEFVRKYKSIPLDLAIWPAVEQNSGLPFRFYQAEYDHTQLTNFPG